MFDDAISAKYRIVKTNLGGETEETIPLGSWRKGGGLEGSKGHAYKYGNGWTGVWIKCRGPRERMNQLRADFANLVPMQVGAGEGTFRVPDSDLDRLLPMIGAKRRRTMSEAAKSSIAKAQEAAKPFRFKAKNVENRPFNEQG
jgi:hypothetical protein